MCGLIDRNLWIGRNVWIDSRNFADVWIDIRRFEDV